MLLQTLISFDPHGIHHQKHSPLGVGRQKTVDQDWAGEQASRARGRIPGDGITLAAAPVIITRIRRCRWASLVRRGRGRVVVRRGRRGVRVRG